MRNEMMHYQHPADLHTAAEFVALAPVEGQAFLAYNRAAERSNGIIPKRYREMIALGVALTTQCAYCIDVHAKAAANAGVTAHELAETAFIAAAVRAGGTLGHALLGLRLFKEAGPA
jgi:AhpD family alkylhydroperoxidase